VSTEARLIVNRIGNYNVNKDSCTGVMNSSKNQSFKNWFSFRSHYSAMDRVLCRRIRLSHSNS